VDKLIPTSWSDPTIEALNNAIPGWVEQRTTAESPVVIADCSRGAGFTNAMLQDDGVHPNSQGDQFLAEQIGPKLIQLISNVRDGTK
jgi:lysophospholipase L1-like esterase